MPPELRRPDITMRVDGDVLEVLFPVTTERIPLTILAVRLERQRKNKVKMFIQRSAEDEPLYAWGWTPTVKGQIWTIDADEEPAYLEFFTEVAQLCGRTVVGSPTT